MDNPDVIRQAKNGSSEAFAAIYDLHVQKIFRFVKLKIQNQPEAEDILQEIFIKAWRGLPSYDPRVGKFSAWLYRVASNTVNDHFRKLYRKPKIAELTEQDDVAGNDSIAEVLTNEADMVEVKKALSGIHPHYQEVIELRFVQDFSVAETARIMGRSQLAVRLVQTRALKKLRRNLKDGFLKKD